MCPHPPLCTHFGYMCIYIVRVIKRYLFRRVVCDLMWCWHHRRSRCVRVCRVVATFWGGGWRLCAGRWRSRCDAFVGTPRTEVSSELAGRATSAGATFGTIVHSARTVSVIPVVGAIHTPPRCKDAAVECFRLGKTARLHSTRRLDCSAHAGGRRPRLACLAAAPTGLPPGQAASRPCSSACRSGTQASLVVARALVLGIRGLARHMGATRRRPGTHTRTGWAAGIASSSKQIVHANCSLHSSLVPAPLPVRALAGAIAVVHGTALGALLQRVQHLLRAAVAAASEVPEVGGLAGQLPARPIHNHGPASTVGEVAAADAAALAVEVLAAEARELDAAAFAAGSAWSIGHWHAAISSRHGRARVVLSDGAVVGCSLQGCRARARVRNGCLA